MIGQIILHYKILEKLGEGGMGLVYKAEDTRLKRNVALKFLPPHLTKDKEANERFIQEAQTASALDHQNICTIHEINDTEDGQMYLVMSCYEGETLKEKIKKGPLEMDEAINIAGQITEGLAKAHQKGIVHRDIKPANIMITADGVVKILDFGLAKLAGQARLTSTGTTVGTIAYISPEQAHGKEVDERTDIWSLGVVLYEMITGQLPFRGEYDQVVLYSIMNEEPKPMAGLRAGVPVELQQIVSKALAKNPDERYQQADEINADLKNLQQGIPIRKSRPAKKSVYRTAKQNRKRAAIIVFAVVLVLVIASYLVYHFATKAIKVEDRTIAIMYIENQTGEEVYSLQANLIIPQIYQQLFANHKDLILPSNQIQNQLETIQKAGSIDKNAIEKILNDARIKYRIMAIIQKTGDKHNYILKTTKPGKYPLVWQEMLAKSDSVTYENFAHIIAEWIAACVWLDEFEESIHKEWNFPGRFTSREIYKNWLSKNICATKAFYQGYYLYFNSQWVNSIPYFKNAWELDSKYIIAAVWYAATTFLNGQHQGLDILLQLKARSGDHTQFEQLWLQRTYDAITFAPDEGVQEFRALTELESYPDVHFYSIGNKYFRIGDYKNAAENFEKFIKSGIFPTWFWGYIDLQRTYNTLGLWKKALEPLKIGLKRNPQSRTLMLKIMEQHLLLGNKKEADKWLVEYEQASRIEAENISDGYMTFGNHYLIKGDFNKAEEYYQKALLEKNITVDQISSIADRFLLMRKYDKAEDILLDAIERFSDDVSPYINLSLIYRSKKDYTNMLKFANKAYELAPSSSYASLGYHVARALSFITNNDSAQAQVEWNYSLDGNVSDIWTFNRKLGFVYSLKGDVELALENLKTSLEKPYDIFFVYRYLYDPDLDNVRNDPRTKDRFEEFLENVKATYPALGKK